MPAPAAIGAGARAVVKAIASRRAQDSAAAAAAVAGHKAMATGKDAQREKQRYPDPVASRGRTSKQGDR